MRLTNLFNFFGIIPYRYTVVTRTYAIKTKRTVVQVLFNLIAPIVTFIFLGISIQDKITPTAVVWTIVVTIKIMSTFICFCGCIFDNYYEAKCHMELLRLLIPCSKTEAIIYRKSLRKVILLVTFYIYYEASQPTFVVLFDEKLDELLFYVILYFLEMIYILNLLYMDSIFIAIQEYLKHIVKLENRTSYHNTTNIKRFRTVARAYGLYIQQKTLLVSRTSYPLILLATNTYLVSSSQIYLMLLYDYTRGSSFIEVNMIIFRSLGAVTQLLGMFSVCYEAQQCTNQEQELSRKLTDLKENFPNHGEELPSAMMMKINVLYRPPAISAYGLFDINLNFFYQMIAAIVTQCVILFQFQSFEQKSE